MIDEEEEVKLEIDSVAAEFAEVTGEITSSKRFISGNRSRDRVRRKPVNQVVASLFEGELR
jgi:hypothetical protein